MARQNVSDTVLAEANLALVKAEGQRKKLLQVYRNEEQVPVYLSPMYRPYFGTVMTVAVNGIRLQFPVDGKTHMIPATFADEINRRRLSIDAHIARTDRMANIVNNLDDESNPGSITLF